MDTCKWMHLCKHNKAWMCTKLIEMAVFIATFHPAILQKLRNTKKYKIPRCCWLGLQTVKFSDLLSVLGKVNRTSSISRDPAQQLAGLKWFVFPDEARGVLSMPWWVRLFLASQRRQFKKNLQRTLGNNSYTVMWQTHNYHRSWLEFLSGLGGKCFFTQGQVRSKSFFVL